MLIAGFRLGTYEILGGIALAAWVRCIARGTQRRITPD